MIKIWKGKSSDLLLTLIYFTIYSIGIHILVSIKHSLKHDENIFEAIMDPSNLFLTLGLTFIFMSPAGVYFRKVPKVLKIDKTNRKLEIQKRNRILNYNMDKIRYYKRNTTFFYILEIHATFESSRNGEFEKLATSIIVPNWGLSWDRKKMEEIIGVMNDMNIEEIQSRPHIPISEHFYN